MFNRLSHIVVSTTLSLASLSFFPVYANNDVTAAELQQEGDKLREEGQSLKAIDIYNHAVVKCVERKDMLV